MSKELRFKSQLGISVGAGALLGTAIQTGFFTDINKIDGTQLAKDAVNNGIMESIEWGLKKKFTGVIASKISKTTLINALKVTGAKTAVKMSASTVGRGALFAAKGAKTIATKALNLLGGPIGLALLLIELTFSLIDAFWNPFKHYSNQELLDMLDKLNEEFRKEFQLVGVAYPLEIKPNITPETKEESDEYLKYYNEYLNDRGLISKEEALINLDIQKRISRMNRLRSFTTEKYIQISNAEVFDEQEYWASYITIGMTEKDNITQRGILLLLTAALYKKGFITRNKRTVFKDISHYVEAYPLRLVTWTLVLFILAIASLFVLVPKK